MKKRLVMAALAVALFASVATARYFPHPPRSIVELWVWVTMPSDDKIVKDMVDYVHDLDQGQVSRK